MNQQGIGAAPTTPQRIYTQSPAGIAINTATIGGGSSGVQRAVAPNQAAVFNQNQRAYSPQTQSSQQLAAQAQQIVRTPIQLMQQQTQSITASPGGASGSGGGGGGGSESSRKRHGGGGASSSASSAAAAAAAAASSSTTSAASSSVGSSSLNSVTGGGSSSMSAATSATIAAAIQSQQLDVLSRTQGKAIRKKGKLRDKIIPQKVRDLVPESQSYMDLLAFERKLDATIMRKRLDIQESLKRPIKLRKKLRVFITNQYFPGKIDADNDEDCVPQWELKIEGRLILDDNKSDGTSSGTSASNAALRAKPRKFSSFFKSLVIELDKELYGPDNHLVETAETDGFQVKRHGDQTLKCTILMLLDYQPPQFKLDQRLAKLLGIHTATRPVIIQSLWQYIKVHKLQDAQEKEMINLDKFMQQIFECERIKFSEIPNKLHMHCMPPDPIVINHTINIETAEPKRTSIYDIEVEIDDVLRDQMKSFLSSSQTQSLAEIGQLDAKIHEQIEQINQLRINREFFMSFSEDPQDFINKWLVSQSNDLKTMLDLSGNPEEERKAQFYHEAWTDEAVCRYFYNKVQQRRAELEQVLGIRN